MNRAPRLEIDLDKIFHNARTLVNQLGCRGISVTGVTKATLGSADTGRINNLRPGEAILLGRETLKRLPIPGLHTDAITLIAEVIEAKIKPSKPTGNIAQTAFGVQQVTKDRGPVLQSILAIGRQDVDPGGLEAAGEISICGASSDLPQRWQIAPSSRAGNEPPSVTQNHPQTGYLQR